MHNKQYIIDNFLGGQPTKEIILPPMRRPVEELRRHIGMTQFRRRAEWQQHYILEEWYYIADVIHDFIYMDNITNLADYTNIVKQIIYPLHGLLPRIFDCPYSTFVDAINRALDVVHTPKPFKKLMRALDVVIEHDLLFLKDKFGGAELFKEYTSILFHLLTEMRSFATIYEHGAKIIISADPTDIRQASVTTTGWSSCFSPQGSQWILVDYMADMPNLAMAVLTTPNGTIMDKISRCFVLFDDFGGVCTTSPQPTTNNEFEAQVILALAGKIESDIDVEFDELAHKFISEAGEPYYGTHKNCKVSFTTGGKY